MCLNTRGGVRYAPLCVISFSLFTPKKPKDEQLLSACYEELQSPPDRLRWCRCRAGLIQREVAERVGVHRDTYMKMENGEVDYWPQLVVDKLAELYRIPMEDLLDDYNCFLNDKYDIFMKALYSEAPLDTEEDSEDSVVPAWLMQMRQKVRERMEACQSVADDFGDDGVETIDVGPELADLLDDDAD